MNKDHALIVINQLPEQFELDVLIEKLIFINKVEQGLEQMVNGLTIDPKQIKQLIRSLKQS